MSSLHSNTLRYWLEVEALTYPDIPKPGRRPSYILGYGEAMPWQPPRQPDTHKYFVYFGLVQKNVLEAELYDLFKTRAEANPGGTQERKKTGKTFLCAIEVNGYGVPIAATLQLAAYAVAFAQKKGTRDISHAGVLARLQDKIRNIESDATSRLADSKWFEEVIQFLMDELDWQPRELMALEQICVHRVALLTSTGKPLRKPPELEPINSFYLSDLQLISAKAASGTVPKQVTAYLAGERNEKARVILSQFDALNTKLQADQFPLGRWPSRFPLFLMQQVAVNTALEELAVEGIFSVNGPPGTGKTTLLMDVIAARIVDRAMVLLTFDNPEHAFKKSPATITYPANKAGEIRSGPCFFLEERLLDCGIVVASANNKAVENITLDLPNLEKVFPHPLSLDGEDFDYFASTAEAILNTKQDAKPQADSADDVSEPGEAEVEDLEGVRCWGLISAALGSKKNRSRVASQLGAFSEFGIQKALQQIEPSKLSWPEAKARFKSAVDRALAIRQAIREFDRLLAVLKGTRQQLFLAVAELRRQEEELQASAGNLYEVLANVGDIEASLTRNLAERKQYNDDWAWWRVLWTRIFNPGLYAEFTARRQELQDEYAELRKSRSELKRSVSALQASVDKLSGAVARMQTTVSAHEKEITQTEGQLSGLGAQLGGAAFDPSEFVMWPVERQQKFLPRSNETYHQARAEVFVAAMALHQAFMKHAGKPFETNFRLALSMLTGDAHIQNHLPDMSRHLWSTFFLVVPVVSSTFASVSRCFSHVGEGEIGLLLVDEAGQAVPSHALGAIWRSRRALIVGDPLQVEPVINMDVKLDFEILKYHGASEEHLLTRHSAQHLADRANGYGAYVTQYDGSRLWVGSPLRVHRRCAAPMFDISNAIAYNGQMVFGPEPEEEQRATVERPLLGPSRWVDVVADDFEDHFSQEEGRAALEFVLEYSRRGLCNKKDGLPDLYVISPFKSVATDMKALLREHMGKWADGIDEEVVGAWLQSHVGTVHTFQGKECESVVFLLGGKSPGARNWAGAKPNIINVAVTRAKRRLYVVGNKQAWAQTTFGAILAARV